MIIATNEQRTQQWIEAKCGIPSASNFDKIIDVSGKRSRQRSKYLYQLAGERVLGRIEETFQSAAMLRGLDLEAEARNFYEITTGHEVRQVGFCTGDDGRYGCSPDGLVGEDGGIEIKCPLIATHVSYLIGDVLPEDYYQQVQGNLLVTGRKWFDFLSYSPGIKSLEIRVEPDIDFLKILKSELELFCFDLDQIVEKIK